MSIDGKTIKSATDKVNGGNTPYIVSAFLNEVGMSIGQVKVNDKSNEMTAIPELLDLIDISGLFVTIDAIRTQTNIANKIIDKKGTYILKVKTKQKDLLDDIKTDNNNILTFILPNLQFTLLNLIKNPNSTKAVDFFDKIEDKIGIEAFKEIIPAILTDRDPNFTDIDGICFSKKLEKKDVNYSFVIHTHQIKSLM